MRDIIDRLIAEYEAMGRTISELDAMVPKNVGLRVKPGDDLSAAILSMQDTGGTIVMAAGDYATIPEISKRGKLVTLRGDGPVSVNGFIAGLRSGHVAFESVSFKNARPGQNHVSLGQDRRTQTTRDLVPKGFAFIACKFEGPARRAIAANCEDLVVDSCDMRNYYQEGVDSQAISGWNGAMNHTIRNTFLEAASENVIYGGSDAASEEMFPRNILFESCTMAKRIEWKTQNYNMKCIFETKNVIGMIVRRCHLHSAYRQAWGNAPAVFLKSCNQESTNPTARTEDFLMEDCIVEDVGTYLCLIGRDDGPFPSGIMKNIKFRNNMFRYMNTEGDGRAIRIGDTPEDVWLDHNTMYDNKHSFLEWWGNAPVNLRITNSIMRFGTYGMLPSVFNPEIMQYNAIEKNPNRTQKYPPTNIYYVDVKGDLSAHVTSDGKPVGCTL